MPTAFTLLKVLERPAKHKQPIEEAVDNMEGVRLFGIITVRDRFAMKFLWEPLAIL